MVRAGVRVGKELGGREVEGDAFDALNGRDAGLESRGGNAGVVKISSSSRTVSGFLSAWPL